MQNTVQQSQAAEETLSRSESLRVPRCEGSVNVPRAHSATYTTVSSTFTTTTTTNGLALCHDVTLDIVTHRWVPVDTHSTPVPERGGCGWPSTNNTTHVVRRSTGQHHHDVDTRRSWMETTDEHTQTDFIMVSRKLEAKTGQFSQILR